MNKKIGIALMALFILFYITSIYAQSEAIALSFGFEEAAIANNESIGLKARIKNLTPYSQCGTMSIETRTNFVEGTISNPSFCLNPGEEMEKTMTLKAINALSGTFPIRVNVDVNSVRTTRFFDLRVANFSEIEIIPFNPTVCRTGYTELSLQIRNNSSKFKAVKLRADNEILLPSIYPTEINLDAFDSKYVKVRVFSNQNTATGLYNISVFADSGTEIVNANFPVTVVDCYDIEDKKDFSVNLNTTGCLSLDKNSSIRIRYSIQNRLDEDQKLNIGVITGGLPVYLPSLTATLEPNETREMSFDINAVQRTEPGDYNLSLMVWNKNMTIEKSICVRVNKFKASEVETSSESIVVEKCKNAVFTILVKNKGDYRNDYNISFTSVPQNVTVMASSPNFTLDKNSEKEIFVSVTTSDNTPTGNYSFNAIIRDDQNQRYVSTLNFSVIGKSTLPAVPIIEFTTFPTQVNIAKTGKQKFVVGIKNITDKREDGISLRITGLPDKVSSKPITGIELLGKDSRNVEIDLNSDNALEGTYNARIELRYGDTKETRNITIVVSQTGTGAEGEGEMPQSFAGFFTFGIKAVADSGIIGVIFLVLSALLILILVISLFAGTRPREVWVRR